MRFPRCNRRTASQKQLVNSEDHQILSLLASHPSAAPFISVRRSSHISLHSANASIKISKLLFHVTSVCKDLKRLNNGGSTISGFPGRALETTLGCWFQSCSITLEVWQTFTQLWVEATNCGIIKGISGTIIWKNCGQKSWTSQLQIF